MAYRPRQEMTKEEMARAALVRSFKYDLLGNDDIVLHANTNPDATTGDFAALVERRGDQGRLAVNPQWSQPFEEFYGGAGNRFLPCAANERTLVRAILDSNRKLSAADLEIVAFDPSVVEHMAVRPEYEAAERAQRAAAERAERERIEAEQIRAEILGWLVDGPRKEMLEKNGAPRVVLQKEVHDLTNRLANMNHAELVAEVTDRREKRRIKVLDAKTFRAETTIRRAAGELPVEQPKMQAAMRQYQTGNSYRTRDGVEFELTRKSLIECANRNPALFREIVRVRGAEQVNDILAGRV